MERRGDKLREHILWTAKDVFLELGFERASMDVIAARSATSKRSVYAHYASKEKLFLAVIELVRGLFLSRLGTPSDYGSKPAEALTVFCSRYLEILIYESNIRMLRVSMAESERFPEQAAMYFNVLFTQIQARISVYLKHTFSLSPRSSSEEADRLLGQILYPRLTRALFGVDPLAKAFDREALSPEFDVRSIRKRVAELEDRLRPKR